MKSGVSKKFVGLAALAWLGVVSTQAQAAGSTSVYRCPGHPVLYTDAISTKEAKEKGCKLLEGEPVTVIQGFKPRAAANVPERAASARVDPADQRARDSDARRILEDELKREDERLASMKADFNNGQPGREPGENNNLKYSARVATMKTAIERKEGDIAALKRELAKHPQ